MAGSVGLVKPQITLRVQLARNISNRGKRGSCVVLTPFGHRLKAIQVVGKTLAEIKRAAIEVDAQRQSRSLDSIPQLSIRRQLVRVPANGNKRYPLKLVTPEGYALRAEEVLEKPLAAIEALSARVNVLRSLTTEEVLWTPLPAVERLNARVKGMKLLSLENFGEVVEVVAGQQIWEVVIAQVDKLEAQGMKLKELVNRNIWALKNDNGMLVNISKKEAERVVAGINNKFGLSLDLLDEEMSEIVSRKFTNELSAKGIFWFYYQAGEKIVVNGLIRGMDPSSHAQWGGLLLGRPKPIQQLGS